MNFDVKRDWTHQELSDLLPEGVMWHDNITPEILREVLSNAFSERPSSAQTDQVWNEAVEAAAHAITEHDRKGREWIPGSLWDQLSGEAAARIRSLKRPLQAQEPASQVGNFGDSFNEQLSRRLESVPLPDYRHEEPCSFCFVRGCNGECSGDGLMGG